MSKKTIEELMADVPLGESRWICSRECVDFHRTHSSDDKHALVEDGAQLGYPGRWQVTYILLGGNSCETRIDKIGDHDRAEKQAAFLRDIARLADEANELGLDALGVDLAKVATRAENRVRQMGSIRIEQPVGGCDGSGEYEWDGNRMCRGPRLAAPCPWCRACK